MCAHALTHGRVCVRVCVYVCACVGVCVCVGICARVSFLWVQVREMPVGTEAGACARVRLALLS